MTGRRPQARVVALAAGIPLLLFVLLTVLLAVHGWGPYPVESTLHSWAVSHRPAPAVRIVGVVTDLGIGVPPYLAAAAAGVLTVRRPGADGAPDSADRRAVRIAQLCAPVVVLAIGQLVRHGLMRAFARPRPPMADWVAASPSGYSFPSGHAFTSAAAAGLLVWALLRGTRRPWTAPAVGVLGLAVIAVGLSRIHLGVHWPFDVVGGWLLAAAWLGPTLPLIAMIGRAPADDGIPSDAPQSG